ncbi:hypothetical protein ACFQE5_06960 [Pseudonocardia hispaniensis]|uniref:EcsC family protein n=1 Tax=Pseudonocardia hispaniensis TaxID=904933 RepID=A0ABW1IZY1_9PSEU
MGEAISDAAVVAVLRPFVRAARPVLTGLREADPFGLQTRAQGAAPGSMEQRRLRERALDALASVKVPGTAAWAAMDVEQRCQWWIHRVGRFTTVIAAVPGLGGALARSFPVSDTVAAAGQGLLLCALAGEHGITDEETLVALLGAVLFRRDLTPRALSPADDAVVAARAAELTGDLADRRSAPTLRQIAGAVWRLGRALFAYSDELDKRPHGRFYHDAIQMVPLVGVMGRYLGEWSGLKRAARKAHDWMAAR